MKVKTVLLITGVIGGIIVFLGLTIVLPTVLECKEFPNDFFSTLKIEHDSGRFDILKGLGGILLVITAAGLLIYTGIGANENPKFK